MSNLHQNIIVGVISGVVAGWVLILSNFATDLFLKKYSVAMVIYFSVIFAAAFIGVTIYMAELSERRRKKIKMTRKIIIKDILWFVCFFLAILIVTVAILYFRNYFS